MGPQSQPRLSSWQNSGPTESQEEIWTFLDVWRMCSHLQDLGVKGGKTQGKEELGQAQAASCHSSVSEKGPGRHAEPSRAPSQRWTAENWALNFQDNWNRSSQLSYGQSYACFLLCSWNDGLDKTGSNLNTAGLSSLSAIKLHVAQTAPSSEHSLPKTRFRHINNAQP